MWVNIDVGVDTEMYAPTVTAITKQCGRYTTIQT